MKCVADMPFNNHIDSPHDNELVQRFYGRFPVRWAVSLFYFMEGNAVQKMMHEFKYRGETYIGQKLGALLGTSLRDKMGADLPDLIIPVPLYRGKKVSRGFNQSEIIAQEIGNILSIRVLKDGLIKIIDTESQTRKGKLERIQNLENVMAIKEDTIQLLHKKHVLLVDDTVTTGATLEACAKILIRNGVESVSVACVAMAK